MTQPKSAEVRQYRGKPTIHVDGEPMAPFFYALTHAYGGRWSWEEVPARNLKLYGDLGVRLFQVDLYFEDIYYEQDGPLDMEKARRQVRGVTDACPEACVVVRVHVNAPFWWNEAHPEECTRYADTEVEDCSYGPPDNNEDGDTRNSLRASLASQRWIDEATDLLKDFCRQLADSPEGASVIGIHVCWGIFGEWHYWGFIGHDPDTGPVMTEHFRGWLREKYGTDEALQEAWGTDDHTLDTATVPGTDERANDRTFFLRDPAAERRVIDYLECQHEVVVDDMLHFCRVVKETWPRPVLVGVFYGYFHRTFGRNATGGHLCIERVLESPWVDYLSSPQAQNVESNGPGGVGHSRGIVDSAVLHGKLWLDEIDDGRHQETYEPGKAGHTRFEADPKYIPVLRRNVVHPLTRGIGFWYYDFGVRLSRGWWDHPVYLERIAEDRRFAERNLHRELGHPADVLLVFDMESFYYLRDRWHLLRIWLVNEVMADVGRSGAVADSIYLFDLPRVDLSRYRAVVFVNTLCMTADQREFVRSTVACAGRTLVWQYMPGIVDGKRLDPAMTAGLTGIDLEPVDGRPKPTLCLDLPGGPSVERECWEPIEPLYTLTGDVEALGTLKGSGAVLVGRKDFGDHVCLHAVMPVLGPGVFRAIFREAGAHIYNDHDDALHAGCGVVWLHTVAGGPRTLRLRNGREVGLDLPPLSTQVFDAETGEREL